MDNKIKITRSIGTRITRLLVISMLCLSLFLMLSCAIISKRYTGKNSTTTMNKASELQVLKIDSRFRLIEQAAENVYNVSESVRPPIAFMKNSPRAVANFLDSFEDMTLSIANQTEGIMAIYYRIDPQICANAVPGFFYVKDSVDGEFKYTEPTDITVYDKSDVEHVGWYYIPIETGEPMWMDEYYNANIGVNMISYVIPIYDNGEPVGVIGLDVNFDSILQLTEDVSIYESSGAVLVTPSTRKIHYNKCSILGSELSDDMLSVIEASDRSDVLLNCRTLDGDYYYNFNTLRNGMKMILYANKYEVDYQSHFIIFTSCILIMLFLSAAISITTRMLKNITSPITEITRLAQSYAQGDWDATVTIDTGDELQALSENIAFMAKKNKEYISYISDMAMKDAMTGIRNKAAYNQYVEKINAEYIGTDKKFALAICDVNHLKRFNDIFGHEEGDKLIIYASHTICKAFAHSPVFRIGGDEFAVFLDSEDFDHRDEIVEAFHARMIEHSATMDAAKPVIAIGMAVIGEDGSSVDALFSIADQRMYENKMDLKNREG